jgi:hypothetical protein
MNNCAVRGNHRAYPVAEVVPPFPDVFGPVGKGHSALAAPLAVLVFPDVFFPVCKGVGALAVENVVPPFPDVFGPAGKGGGALAVALVVLEFPDVFVPVGIGDGELAVKKVVPPFPNVFVPVGIGVGALAVHFAVLEFPDVFVPVGIGDGELAVPYVVLEFPDVFVPVGIGDGALAVAFVVPPFPDVFVPGPLAIWTKGVGAKAVVPKHVRIFGTRGQCLGKGSAWGAQQPDGGKSYENKGSDPLHTGSLTENVGSGESDSIAPVTVQGTAWGTLRESFPKCSGVDDSTEQPSSGQFKNLPFLQDPRAKTAPWPSYKIPFPSLSPSSQAPTYFSVIANGTE